MNIAVISSPGIASGKSSFISLLATTFASTQQKRVAIFSTGDINELISLNETMDNASLIKSANIYRAQILSSSIREEEIWDYGFRLGEGEVFAFDIAPRTLPINEQVEVFEKTLARVKAPMVLVEIQGDPTEDLNKHILKICDVVLYVFNFNPKDIKVVKHFMGNADPQVIKEKLNTLDPNIVYKTGYICQKFDNCATSEKEVAKLLNVDSKNVMQVPYNPVVAKLCMQGRLNNAARLIVKGSHEIVALRPKLLEVMQYLYDNQSRKYIKGVDKWAR